MTIDLLRAGLRVQEIEIDVDGGDARVRVWPPGWTGRWC